MAWWQWLLAWLILSLILAPIAGHYLKRLAEHYPEPPSETNPT